MECDALFAESDDDIEVLPIPSETIENIPADTESNTNEQTPKPVSSNYVNSTTPNQPFEVYISSLTHPVNAHTPVPEEYQPLPDSSSSLDYSFGVSNPDSTDGSSQRRIPDVNIRYQPKPHSLNQHSYYYRHYPHYPGIQTAREYAVPYHNNVIVLSDNRNFLSHPLAYANGTHGADNPTEYEYLHARPNVYNQETATGDNLNQPNGLERPSRKLNISPRRRQSKENEVPNFIEVSSEEEDNVSTPRKKQCDNGAGHQAANGNGIGAGNGNCSNSGDIPRVEIKGEPGNVAIRSTNVTVPNVNNLLLQTVDQRQQSSENNNTQALNIAGVKVQIKQENSGCAPHSNCGCKVNLHSDLPQPVHNHSDECDQYRPNHSQQSGSQSSRITKQSSNNASSSGEASGSIIKVKEEPGTQQPVIKQEPFKQENVTVKAEILGPCQVKTEPGTTSSNTSENIEVKPVLDNGNRCCEIDGSGDRIAKQTSPQPGTSSGRQVADNRPSINNQVINLNMKL